LLLVLGTGGCNLDWEKPDLGASPPARFREAAPRSASTLRGATDFVARFHSRELSALVAEALDKNFDIAAGVARIKQADAQARLASAASWPALGVNHVAQTNRSPGNVLTPNAAGGAISPVGTSALTTSNVEAVHFGFFQLGFTASYEIDFWGKNEDASNAARLLANASRFERDVIEIATVTAVLNAYFQVLAAQDRLHVARENVRIAADVFEIVKRRLTVGTATALDATQQEALLAEQRATLPPLEQHKRQSETLLALLLGRAPENFDIRNASLASLAIPDVTPGLPSEVLLRRPDIAQAEAKLASQEFSVLEARAAFFPSITLTGAYGLQSAVIKNLLRPEAIAWQAAADLAQPLFDGYALQGRYELQKGRYEELATLYRKQIVVALSDVENALIAVRATARQATLQTGAVAAWRRAYEVASARLREGTIDGVTLATTQTSLFQSQDRLALARLERARALASLYQALGGGWSPTTRGVEVAQAQEAYDADKGPWP
jgi:outer membrane protein, multidrug efflux system